MLHVLLMILKIIGFLLLGILGLLFCLVLLVLFVPIRYKVEGSYYKKPKGTVRVTWLLHILSVLVSYEEDFLIAVKVFGFSVFKSDNERITEPIIETVKEEAENILVEEPVEQIEEAINSPPLERATEHTEAQPIQNETKRKNIKVEPKEFWLKKYWNIFINKIKHFIQAIFNKIKQLYHTKEKIMDFIQNPDNQYTFKLVLKQIKKLLRHVLPQKATGTITFGFEDPYTTGRVLSVLSIAYAWYGKKLQITPVFDEKIIEGEGCLKGRIRIGTLLILGIRVLMNKNFRVLIKR